MIGLALTGTVLCLLLKQYKPEYAVVVSIVCGVLLFAGVLANLEPAFASMNELMQNSGIDAGYTKTIVKALGICYVVQLASDSCKDAGQSAIASKVELAGKVSIVLLCLPMFQNLAEIAMKLIAG